MNTRIFDDVLEARNGHYTHALEVQDLDDLCNIIESFIDNEGDKYSIDDYTAFFESMYIYSEDYTGFDGFMVAEYIAEYLF